MAIGFGALITASGSVRNVAAWKVSASLLSASGAEPGWIRKEREKRETD